jgi:pimeloyl-ACP methyl ester carboxylesterase
LSDRDRFEHLPYVRAGFFVAAYDLSGAVADDASGAELAMGVEQFRRTEAGLANARAALDLARAELLPHSIEHVYAVGHSSPGAVALNVAAAERLVDAVVAFAPVTDLHAWVGPEQRNALDDALPGFDDYLRGVSPVTHVAALARKPVFLFVAEDDPLISVGSLQAFLDHMPNPHAQSRLLSVPSGGHYTAMMKEGIAAALAWLQDLPMGEG